MTILTIALTTIALGQPRATPALAVGETMTVDANTTIAGVQANRILPAGGTFSITLEATSAGAAAGYQWELQWDDPILNFVSNDENEPGTGASLCAPANPNPSAPAGKEWVGLGAGCARTSGTIPATVLLVTIDLTCLVTDGTTTELHLVSLAQDGDFGSTFFAPGGGNIASILVDASVTCGTPPPATNTPTNTPTQTFTPSNTPTPTNTGTPTNTPTPSNTLPPSNTPTPPSSVTPNAPTKDSDYDGLSDSQENSLGTCPGTQPKFQNMPICHVGGSLFNPLLPDPRDTDGDGLREGWEFFSYGTGLLTTDTDLDGLLDGIEVNTKRSDPLKIDTDGDGLPDGVEGVVILTDPVNPNTDGDGCTDGQEEGFNKLVGGDRDPLSPWDFYDVPVPTLSTLDMTGKRNRSINIGDVGAILSYVGTVDDSGPNVQGQDYDTDYNGNGVDDGREYDRTPSADGSKPWQTQAPNGSVTIADVVAALSSVGHVCAPGGSAPPLDDADGDGLTDLDEESLGTCGGLVPKYANTPVCHQNGNLFDPLIPDAKDTESDGLRDAWEVISYLTNPLSVDTDLDGLADGLEVNTLRSSPHILDTDVEGVPDGLEYVVIQTDPVNPNTDGDGCSDAQEIGTNENAGGDRNPANPWDFADVVVPAISAANPTNGVRNMAVTIADVTAALFYVGTTDGGPPNVQGVSYNTDLNGDAVLDGVEYDRLPSNTPGQPWRSREPNAAVTIQDVIVILTQVGDICT